MNQLGVIVAGQPPFDAIPDRLHHILPRRRQCVRAKWFNLVGWRLDTAPRVTMATYLKHGPLLGPLVVKVNANVAHQVLRGKKGGNKIVTRRRSAHGVRACTKVDNITNPNACFVNLVPRPSSFAYHVGTDRKQNEDRPELRLISRMRLSQRRVGKLPSVTQKGMLFVGVCQMCKTIQLLHVDNNNTNSQQPNQNAYNEGRDGKHTHGGQRGVQGVANADDER